MSSDKLLNNQVDDIIDCNVNNESSREFLLHRIKLLEGQLEDRPSDKTTGELIRIFICELFGTALFACGIVNSKDDVSISIYLFAAIFLIGRFTGGHVNPAVTMSFYSSNKINAFTMRVYWTAQVFGAILGAFIAYMVAGQVTSPLIESSQIQWIVADFCGETLGTFIFVLFIHIQVHEQTQLTDNNLFGIGLIVTGLYFGRTLTYHTGGCLNPAMGVGLQIFQSTLDGNWDRMATLWIFIFGPISGASLASEFYRNVYVGLLPSK